MSRWCRRRAGTEESPTIRDEEATAAPPVGLSVHQRLVRGASLHTLSRRWARMSRHALWNAAGRGRGRHGTHTRMLAIGAPISGYLDVEVSSEELESLGVEVIDIAGSEISAAFAAVDDVRTASLISDLRERFDGSAVDDPTLERSARLALAMDSLCRTHEATAGAVNCHGDTLRWNSGVDHGLPGRGALHAGRQTLPCTGDSPRHSPWRWAEDPGSALDAS